MFIIGSEDWMLQFIQEIRQIRQDWNLKSDRRLSDALRIDRKTLSNRRFDNLGNGLQLDTIDRIYATLFLLFPFYFERNVWEAIFMELIRSRLRILMRAKIHPEVLYDLEAMMRARKISTYENPFLDWLDIDTISLMNDKKHVGDFRVGDLWGKL